MKKNLRNLLVIALVICSLLSLSSCYLSDLGIELPSHSEEGETDGGKGGDTYIRVDGGDNYDITITPQTGNDILAASKALLSSVSVFCTFEAEKTYFGKPTGQTTTYTSAGSGVIYKLDKNKGCAYIITNYHVVYDADCNSENHISRDIDVYLYGQQLASYAIKATYIGGSMEYDLAVLRVEGSLVLMESNAMPVDIADSSEVSVLETAIAVGNPEGSGISATVGHVNVESEYINMLGADEATPVEIRVIRVDTAVNSGNSGGGLFNAKGEMIGIVNAKMADSEVDNIGYAIPSNVVRAIADNVIYYCDGTEKESVYRCLMGITVTASKSTTSYDTETGKIHIIEEVMISEMTSTAGANGYLAVNDIINSITVDGRKHEVTRIYNVVDAMLDARVGSTVVVNVTRGTETLDVTIPITESMLKQCK